MAVAAILLVLISSNCVSSLNENTIDEYCNLQLNCPPWMQAMGSECVCRSDLPHVFSCENQTTFLDISNCLSIDHNDSVSVGACPYNYPNVSDYAVELPSSLSDHDLDTVFCYPLKRKGILCHRCMEGFGVAPLSLEYVCAECPDNTAGWWVLFFLLQFGPVTIFYLINLVWQVSFAKAPFRCFVFFSQIVFWIMSTQSVIIARNNLSVVGQFCFYAVELLNGIWSLNFVSVLPPFCVSTSFTNIHFVYLQYFVAVYPLFLIALTLVLYMLHERNFKPVVIFWKPFRRCFISTRELWDSKSSIVNVFVNFCLFSLSNIISIVSTSFTVSKVFNLCAAGEVETSLRVDPSSPYPDPGLLVLSLVFSIITITVIALVGCYPLKCMKLCLKRCCRTQIFLYFKAFFDDFTSTYKDGTTEGSRCNFQYLVVMYPILLILSRVIFLLVSRSHRFLLTLLSTFLLFSLAMFVAVARPYKKVIDNVIESLLIFLLALSFGFHSLYLHFSSILLASASLFLVSVPHGCFAVFIVYSAYKRYKRYCGCCCNEKKATMEDNELPDRFVNAENYPQYNSPKTSISK